METETTAWSDFPNRGKAIVEQISTLKKKKEIQKSWIVRATVTGQNRKVNNLSNVIWDYNKEKL